MTKPVGEPDAGNPHVRFDERGWETERCRMAPATAPILDSTTASNRCGAKVRTRSERSGHAESVGSGLIRRKGPQADSKYPPAKPGALGCEPLKAAEGAAEAAPDRVGHLKVAHQRHRFICSRRLSSSSCFLM